MATDRASVATKCRELGLPVEGSRLAAHLTEGEQVLALAAASLPVGLLVATGTRVFVLLSGRIRDVIVEAFNWDQVESFAIRKPKWSELGDEAFMFRGPALDRTVCVHSGWESFAQAAHDFLAARGSSPSSTRTAPITGGEDGFRHPRPPRPVPLEQAVLSWSDGYAADSDQLVAAGELASEEVSDAPQVFRPPGFFARHPFIALLLAVLLFPITLALLTWFGARSLSRNGYRWTAAGVILVGVTLAVVSAGWWVASFGKDKSSDSSTTSCASAWADATSGSRLTDTLSDYRGTLLACDTVTEWVAENRAHGERLGSDASTVDNLCREFGVTSLLCTEASDQAPLAASGTTPANLDSVTCAEFDGPGTNAATKLAITDALLQRLSGTSAELSRNASLDFGVDVEHECDPDGLGTPTPNALVAEIASTVFKRDPTKYR